MRLVLTTVVLLCGASPAFAQTDFNWRGAIGSGQTLEIRGVNGEVNATASGSGDAEVYARKSANRSDPEQVRVAVVPHAGGILVCAVYPAPAGVPPHVPGLEYAGVVVARGPNVHRHAVGAHVMGIVGGGAMAKQVVVHEDEAMAVPEHLSLEHAAAVPEAFLTAHDALFTQGGRRIGIR